MRSSIANVEIDEALAIRVGRRLLADSYALSDHSGTALSCLTAQPALGILWSDPDRPPRSWLFGLITRPAHRVFIGFLKFGEGAWTFTVYGRRHLADAGALARTLSAEFGTLIRIRLESEEERRETFPGSFDDGFI